MNSDSGWINVTDTALLYGRNRSWVRRRIKRFNIATRRHKRDRLLRIEDFIRHVGEPPTPQMTEDSKPETDITEDSKPQTDTADDSQPEADMKEPSDTATTIQQQNKLLKQENGFLRDRITDMNADRTERQRREERLVAQLEVMQRIVCRAVSSIGDGGSAV